MKHRITIWAAAVSALLSSCASTSGTAGGAKLRGSDELAVIETTYGEIWVQLHEQTPVHKANFLRLAKDDFYAGLTFHRVIQDFMIQGGDPNSRQGADSTRVGLGGNGKLLQPEIVDSLKHVRGAVAAARMADKVNPDRLSNGTQFYIVQSRKGAHHLDGAYTVFGEVVKGLEVVDRIAQVEVETGRGPLQGRPEQRIEIDRVRVVKMPRKKIAEMKRRYVGQPEAEEAPEEDEDKG